MSRRDDQSDDAEDDFGKRQETVQVVTHHGEKIARRFAEIEALGRQILIHLITGPIDGTTDLYRYQYKVYGRSTW